MESFDPSPSGYVAGFDLAREPDDTSAFGVSVGESAGTSLIEFSGVWDHATSAFDQLRESFARFNEATIRFMPKRLPRRTKKAIKAEACGFRLTPDQRRRANKANRRNAFTVPMNRIKIAFGEE